MSNGFVYVIAAIAYGGSFFVKWWLKRTYRQWSLVPNQYGVTGAQTAAVILQDHGLNHVKITGVRGALTDHYDPAKDILRLSETNYGNTSVAAMAVSAHEAGHALQDASDDLRLRFRRFLVPLAALGGRFGPMVAFVGLMINNGFVLRLGVFLLGGNDAVPDCDTAGGVQCEPPGTRQLGEAGPHRSRTTVWGPQGSHRRSLYLRCGRRYQHRLFRVSAW